MNLTSILVLLNSNGINMKAIIYSGGMDSFTLLHYLLRIAKKGDDIYAISFSYGQRHSREIHKAERTCDQLSIPHVRISLPSMGKGPLTGHGPIPEGHYTDENMKQTVVPNRNMIMLAHAVASAIDKGADSIYYGAHAGDHAIYPDCRPEFLDSVNETVAIGNYNAPTIYAPFMNMTKGQILELGLGIGLVPRNYLSTWTCYNGRELACGKCGACVERLEAFDYCNVEDPIEYEHA